MSNICIAIDAMGGDKGPIVTVPAALKALTEYSELHLILVGDQAILERTLKESAGSWDTTRLQIQHTTQVVAMDEVASFGITWQARFFNAYRIKFSTRRCCSGMRKRR